MIKINQLTKYFGEFCAVDKLSFTVEPGEVLGFLGPNGAGKSTSMKMITGFLTPTSGSVSVMGHDIVDNPLAAKECMGYLPEGAPSYQDMTVIQFLGFIAEMRGIEAGTLQARIAHVVQQTQLSDVLYQPVETLSKGFKRRVGLAQAIIHDPQVLILDEPTDGLDPNQKHQVRQLIQGMAKDKIIIVSTHILEEVSAVCSRAMIIDRGRLIADGTPSELESRSRYHGAVSLQVTQLESLKPQIKSLAQVAEIEETDDAERIIILPRSGQEVHHEVSQLLAQKNLTPSEFHVERGRLDDVFRTLTTNQSV
ncbi:MAG: ABC transporter ATP-binding protein [Pseudomonadota bacterium]